MSSEASGIGSAALLDGSGSGRLSRKLEPYPIEGRARASRRSNRAASDLEEASFRLGLGDTKRIAMPIPNLPYKASSALQPPQVPTRTVTE